MSDDGGMFDDIEPEWGPDINGIRELNRETAYQWVVQWHYSHTMPGGGTVPYGAYAGDLLAVVMLSMPTNAHGVAAKYGLERWNGNREISRVIVHPDSPWRNGPSQCIAACFDHWAARGYDWVFSYADTGQNHHGGIYQALNGVYVGISDMRPGYLAGGVPMHPRSVVARWGTQAWPRCRELAAREGCDLVKVTDMLTAKHLYILPIGKPAVRRAIRRALEPHRRPYPRRDPDPDGLVGVA